MLLVVLDEKNRAKTDRTWARKRSQCIIYDVRVAYLMPLSNGTQ